MNTSKFQTLHEAKMFALGTQLKFSNYTNPIQLFERTIYERAKDTGRVSHTYNCTRRKLRVKAKVRNIYEREKTSNKS